MWLMRCRPACLRRLLAAPARCARRRPGLLTKRCLAAAQQLKPTYVRSQDRRSSWPSSQQEPPARKGPAAAAHPTLCDARSGTLCKVRRSCLKVALGVRAAKVVGPREARAAPNALKRRRGSAHRPWARGGSDRRAQRRRSSEFSQDRRLRQLPPPRSLVLGCYRNRAWALADRPQD